MKPSKRPRRARPSTIQKHRDLLEVYEGALRWIEVNLAAPVARAVRP